MKVSIEAMSIAPSIAPHRSRPTDRAPSLPASIAPHRSPEGPPLIEVNIGSGGDRDYNAIERRIASV